MKKRNLLLIAAAFTTNIFAQTVTTFTGVAGTAGSNQGSSATLSSATFDGPTNLFIDNSGKMWITEIYGNRVRMIDQITTPASATIYLRAGSGVGNSGSTEGTGVNASFSTPTGVVVSTDGTIYIADLDNNCIRKIEPFSNLGTAQLTSTFAGTKGPTGGFADGQGTAAKFNQPSDLAIDDNNNLYVADAANNRIRKIAPDGTVTTLAGGNTFGDADGTGTSATFSTPKGLGWYSNTELLVADLSNGKIRKVNINTGEVTTVAGTGAAGTDDGDALTVASFRSPVDVAVDDNKNIYVTESFPVNTIRKITGSCVTTFVGTVGTTGSDDGNGAAASFNNPAGILFNNNVLYVCDQDNHTIRKVSVPATSEMPVAQFNADKTTGTITDVFSFSNQSTNSVSYQWTITPNTYTFQGGVDQYSKDIDIMFTADGMYTVKLKVKSNCWGSDSISKTDYINIGTTGILDVINSSFVQVYPNPTKGLVEINLNDMHDANMLLKIMDIHGKLVYERPVAPTKETIDLTTMAKGIYVLNVSGDKTTVTKKLIVE